MSAGPEEGDRRTREGGATSVVGLDDPARGDDPGEFQGHHLGAGVSVIVVNASPGDGPRLHRHPYEEVFVVQEGTATFTAGDEEIEAGAGQVVVVPAGAWHGFKNRSEEAALMVNIHPAATMVQEDRH